MKSNVTKQGFQNVVLLANKHSNYYTKNRDTKIFNLGVMYVLEQLLSNDELDVIKAVTIHDTDDFKNILTKLTDVDISL